jgi:tetratricopeptide (TPR) repeat protein
MAVSMMRLAYPQDALEYLQLGERFCKELEDQKSLAVLYSQMGHFYSAKGDARTGMRHQQNAFERLERLQDSRIASRIGANLGFSLNIAGEYKQIVRIAPRILALLGKTNQVEEIFGMPVDLRSLVHGTYGHALGYIGQFEKGEKACRKAVDYATKADLVFGVGVTKFLYGCLFLLKGDGKDALTHLKASIEYFEKSKDALFLPLAWCLAGEGYRLAGNLDKALEFAEKGLRIKKDIGVPVWLSAHHLFLSRIHFDSGNDEKSMGHAEQARQLAQKCHEKYFEALSWLQFGQTLGRKNPSESDAAKKSILKGLEILKALETKPAYAEGLFYLGELFFSAGQKDRAFENLKKAKELFVRMGMDSWREKTERLRERI